MFQAIPIAVLTISDSRSLAEDRSGQLLQDLLTAEGHTLAARALVPDDIYQIRAQVSNWVIDPNIAVIITTGGTGLTGRDGTPEAIQPLLDKEMTGFGELFRFLSYEEIKTSTLQSRALAGLINGRVIFCLPGSSGACRTAWQKLIVHQLNADHQPCNLVELMPRFLEK